jgi:hypothetical protein
LIVEVIDHVEPFHHSANGSMGRESLGVDGKRE